MKQIGLLLFTVILFSSSLLAQEFDKSINKDSLLQIVLKRLPKEQREPLLKAYNEGSDQAKEFFLLMLSMPSSSKKELIDNIDSNYDKVNHLRTEYARLVPQGYIVNIEFNAEDKLINSKESINLTIVRDEKGEKNILQEWNLMPNDEKLSRMLKMVNWDVKTLALIKRLLSDAHCISVDNGEITTIGFARSGMGKYSYKLFSHALSGEQAKTYNDGCRYILYKRNIVLEYGGGAIGSQCFPD